MKRKIQGYYVPVSTVGEKVKAFVPGPLPPKPDIDWTPALRKSFDEALLALGRLDSVSVLIPYTPLFLYSYVRKEAVLSSMIEGTQSSISDLLLFELDQQPGVPLDDVQEVSNYTAALHYGLKRLKEGFPLTLRLIREMHAILLERGRGAHKQPGEFRQSQNWIGGTRPGNAAFVPPPADQVVSCMGHLEAFLHDKPVASSPLLKAALAHVQFETIHPFLDGNGRVGRLLIPLILCDQQVLREPLLYLSLYFKEHRQYYYELLNTVRMKGDWESWLTFFARAVSSTARQAGDTAMAILDMIHQDRNAIASLGRASDSADKIYKAMLERPIATPGLLTQKTDISPATVNKSLRHLEALGIIRELTSRKRSRIYSYVQYVEILNHGTGIPE